MFKREIVKMLLGYFQEAFSQVWSYLGAVFFPAQIGFCNLAVFALMRVLFLLLTSLHRLIRQMYPVKNC